MYMACFRSMGRDSGSRMGTGSDPVHSVASGRCLGDWGTVGDRVERALGLPPHQPQSHQARKLDYLFPHPSLSSAEATCWSAAGVISRCDPENPLRKNLLPRFWVCICGHPSTASPFSSCLRAEAVFKIPAIPCWPTSNASMEERDHGRA